MYGIGPVIKKLTNKTEKEKPNPKQKATNRPTRAETSHVTEMARSGR